MAYYYSIYTAAVLARKYKIFYIYMCHTSNQDRKYFCRQPYFFCYLQVEDGDNFGALLITLFARTKSNTGFFFLDFTQIIRKYLSFLNSRNTPKLYDLFNPVYLITNNFSEFLLSIYPAHYLPSGYEFRTHLQIDPRR